MSRPAPDCYDCKWRLSLGSSPRMCEAFLDEIPKEIFFEGVIHDKPMFGQTNNCVFENGDPEDMTLEVYKKIHNINT